MTKDTNTQWQKRFDESLASKQTSLDALSEGSSSFLFLNSSSDVGVMRNGGRNGARFAPKAILNSLKKWALTDKHELLEWAQIEVSNQALEKLDFQAAQDHEAGVISKVINKHPQRLFHLGGGHDHIYPLLKALGETFSKIIVLNIDAHADTRTDDVFHSGTPFRQFAESYQGEFHLFQYGLHEFANSSSTLSPLAHGSQHRLFFQSINDVQLFDSFLENISLEVNENCAFVFSLDADALSSDLMEAVSAVNPQGITREQLFSLWNFYTALTASKNIRPIVGIYEVNPLYDSISGKSIRTLSSMIYKMIG